MDQHLSSFVRNRLAEDYQVVGLVRAAPKTCWELLVETSQAFKSQPSFRSAGSSPTIKIGAVICLSFHGISERGVPRLGYSTKLNYR